MLDELRIQNFALIDQWEISFTKGESVFTGETGSGKSIFVDALSFLSGERADRQIQRDPSIPTMVEGIFLLPHSEVFLQRLSEEGIDPEENTLIVRRELTSNGSRQRLNGKAVTVSSLRAIMSFLIDIHSQNAQSLLSNRDLYLPLLDQYIGDEAETQKQELQKLLRKLKSVQKKLDDLELDPEELEREIDLLQYQISEIEGTDLEQIHEEELTKEHKKLSSAAGRVEDVQALLQEIENGQSSIRYALHSLARALDEMARKNPDLVHYKDMAWQMDAEAEDLVDGIEKYRDSIVIDPQRLDEIDQIFSMLQRLKRKYGSNTEEILGFSEHAKKRLRLLENAQQEKDSLIEERTQIRKQIKNTADVLSDLRKNGAGRLEKRIRAELLEMAIKAKAMSTPFSAQRVAE
ncbi:MAG: AAA family ATPase, partial [Peptoniphilaceae bacterium]|nr:AAA family ATPase [Peptoniphilaceae bacterium]